MKKILLLVLLTIFIPFSVFSYTPTLEDRELIEKTISNLEKVSKNKSELWFNKNLNSFNFFINNYEKDDRIKFILSEVRDFLDEKLFEIVEKRTLELEKKLENNLNEKRKSFFVEHWKNITNSLNPPNNCIIYFDFVDKIAIENDFPVELILATWWREFNCNLSNPANGWWPFQITSQYYTPWTITLEEFEDSIIKFIDFSRNKWSYFNDSPYHNLKTRFWEENINLSYDNYNLRDLRLHSVLYNWIRANTVLETNVFANSNLHSWITSNSDGIVTRFLKILNWRIENSK